MGEAVLGAFLPVLLEKLADQEVIKYFGRLKGVNKKVLENWSRTLTAIQAVLSDAEEKQLTQNAVEQWLDDLRDLAYNVQDILSTYDTNILEQRIQKQQGSTSKSWISKISKPKFNFGLNSKIASITGRLEEITARERQFGLKKLGVPTKPWKMTPTTSRVEGPVIGRDDAKAHIVDKLLSKEESTTSNYQVVGIVGTPGVGKTTLAKHVFNDAATEQFHPKGWVCVSDDFDLVRVTNAILGSVTKGGAKEYKELSTVQDKLSEELGGKNFLIVLDDVWHTCRYVDWDKLQSAFCVGAPRSKIIVTTRDVNVAKRLGDADPHNLKAMSGDDCWRIFEHHALLHNRHQDVEELLPKEKIVKKCNGLPLVARTLGGLLRCKRVDEWEEILDHKLWNQSDCQADILPALKLSYHYLPSNLKRCFSYCAILPNDYEFEEMQLVLLWMAEGLIPLQQSIQMEDLGRDYFQELVSRSLFQKSSKGNSRYIMHDLVADLACWAAGSSCSKLQSMQINDSSPGRCLPRVRHSSFIRGEYDGVEKFEVYYEATCSRTFLSLPLWDIPWNIRSYHVAQKVISDLLPKLQYLRLLSLSGYAITELPNTIGQLKHLRYLDLSHTLITSLPDSTTTLYNLQTLILHYCYRLKALPTSMKNLVNLRHLDISETPYLEELPPQLGRLTSLQTLPKFVIGKGSGSGVSEIGSLDLQGTLRLSRLENVTTVEDARKANLKRKERLEALLLEWSSSSTVSTEDAAVVLGMLQPHSKIKELTMEGYAGFKFATWIGDPSFTKMVSVRLEGCNRCQFLPPFGQLASLKQLYINGMDAVKSVGQEFYGEGKLPFQVLESLEFEYLRNWKEWSPCEQSQSEVVFSCMKKLSISDCSKLEGSLPEKLESLAELEIVRCENLVVSISNYKQLHESDIGDCKMVVYKTNMVKFDLLESLSFSNISELRFETEAFMKSLENVKKLKITGCEKLNEDRLLQHLISLDDLYIEDNSGLVEKLGEEAEQLLQLQILDYCKLEYLQLSKCASLVNVPEGFHHLKFLQKLHLYECSSLVSFPDAGLPPCLQVINIEKCDSLLHFTKYQIPPSLRRIMIWDCEKLKSLIEKEEEVVVDASCSSYCLEVLEIEDCPSLLCLLSKSQLPRSLKQLQVRYCRELVLITERFLDDTCQLEIIEISVCPNMKSLPEGMCHLTNLQSLNISDCKSLVSLPEGMCHLTNLQSLTIGDCGSLVSLPRLGVWPRRLDIGGRLDIRDCGSLVSLPRLGVWPREMCIIDCEKLDVAELVRDMTMHSTNNVEDLRIDYCEGLSTCSFPPSLTSLGIYKIRNCKALMAGLHTLTSLRELTLWGKEDDDTNLVSFPPGEKGKDILLPTSLVQLRIQNFPNLKKLSKGFQFLTSLQSLYISNCPKLEEKCRGGYRSKMIAHIPCVRINFQPI